MGGGKKGKEKGYIHVVIMLMLPASQSINRERALEGPKRS